MKSYQSAIFLAFWLGVVVIFDANLITARSTNLLGAKECTWGPSYWCSNLTNAKSCGAVHHCIQTIWEKQTVPEDNDSICQICLDMVKQARAQLESNETANDLKLVFEGSCKLIPIHVVQKECIQFADNFIPELVQTLASQMNPQVVCSVAGLCNNARIDRLLAEMPVTTMKPHTDVEITEETTTATNKQLSCSGCNNVATVITNKFRAANRDDILENLLHICGGLSSYSDACSNIVLSYFNDIYDHISESISSESICHISGVCSSKYHQHPEIVEIRPMSNIGVVPVKEDLTCDLCEQLVGHLRDLLIANTTEKEFKMVLQGLCKQAKDFTKECLSIVDQYYDVVYKYLVDNLDKNGACFLIGICPKGLRSSTADHPIMPLLPTIPRSDIKVTIKEKSPLPQKMLLGADEPKFTNQEINAMQLPIDKLMGPKNPNELIENGQICTLCEYFMHFVQEALSTPVNEDKIKKMVSAQCNKFPTSLRFECENFINTYGDAVIALLVQEIDPRQVCPKLLLCPKNSLNEDMEVFAPQPIKVSIITTKSDSATCPLCLFAVTQAQEMIKNDKTKARVKTVLEQLCTHAPKALQTECTDFVDTYSSELIEMLVTDFTSQQICVYLKVCSDKPPTLDDVNIDMEKSNEADIITNEIPDNTINGNPIYEITNTEEMVNPECYLCKLVLTETLKHIVNKNSKKEIINDLRVACKAIHQVAKKCDSYVDKYGEKIAELIMQDLTAEVICSTMMWCATQESELEDLVMDEAVKIDIIAIPAYAPVNTKKNAVTKSVKDSECTLCEFIMSKLEQQLKDKATQEEIKETFTKICAVMPRTLSSKCNKFVEQYADLVLDLLSTMPPKEICVELQLCPKFNLAHDEVVECGVCHGAVDVLLPKIQSNPKLDVHEMTNEVCDSIPAQYNAKCTELITYYGESIKNLVKANTDQSKICAEIGQCFKGEKSVDSFVKITSENQGSDLPRSRQPRDDKLVGEEKCTWGPSHWCESKSNADECGTHEWCIQHKKGYAEQST